MSCMSQVIRSEQIPIQVSCPGVQFPFVGGDTFGTDNDAAAESRVNDDYIVDITATQEA